MMAFLDERAEFEDEIDAYYRTCPNDVSAIREYLDAVAEANPSWSPFQLKALVYDTIAERCPVRVFRHFPFAFEVGVGKMRTDLGAGGIGGWLKTRPGGRELLDCGSRWWAPWSRAGLSLGWPVLDDNHHSLGIDNVFRYGLDGLRRCAAARRARVAEEAEREFLESMMIGLRAQMRLAGRFAAEADRLAAAEGDPVVGERLRVLAATMRKVPAAPPATFCEGLATVLYMRETTQALEGNGISILGHLDRVLGPLYEADLAGGRITRAAAADLLGFFLALSDARFGIRDFGAHVGTNTTVVIGGCDRDGRPVFNEVTRLVIEAYAELGLVDPKLNARISAVHPDEYFGLLAGLSAQGCNSLSVFNDDVVIPANRRMGKALEDCRLYVGGGCQENVLENTEVNSRATIYLSLPGVLLMGLFPERWAELCARDNIEIAPLTGEPGFDEFYAANLRNLRAVLRAHVDQRNRTEAEGVRFNPCPLHSATIDDCMEKARDMMAGGARYNFGSVSLAGIGTLIDSLYAIRTAVFERGLAPMAQLVGMLATDFAGEEAFRQHLAQRIPKYGQEDEAIRAFSARVFADVAAASGGLRNTRGGSYEASLFAFRSFVNFGEKTGATPDGRRAGEHLSPGMSPSMLSLGRECSISQVLGALGPLDMTDYPVVAVLDAKLPVTRTRQRPEAVAAVLRCFVEYGGSVLQLNVVDPQTLVEAHQHPERHPDLVVRISGYSAYFRTLSPAMQDEVIERTLATA